jgi:nucleoside-diphosphate-sugar epimerase
MKILITGASGFVGQNLLSYFKHKFEITCLNRNDLAGDITSLSLNDNEAIIHLAGKAHDLKNVSQPNDYYQINYELTKKLYDAFLKSDAKKFIFISSVKAAADQVEGTLSETTLPNPQTHYGKSKLMAEQYIEAQPLPADKAYYILRPCMIHGPGNKGNLNLLYHFVKKGIPYPLAAFQNKRSFLSIENLSFVIEELINRNDVPMGIYQVADDETLSTTELIKIIGSTMGKKIPVWRIPAALLKGLAKAGDLIKLPLTTERLNKLTENYVVSNDKIKKALSKEFPVKSRDGIAATIRSF